MYLYRMIGLTLLLSMLLYASLSLAALQYTAHKFNIHTGESHPIDTFSVLDIPTRHHSRDPSPDFHRKRSGVSYSGNWCGAVQNPSNSTGHFINAFGKWNVVDVSVRPGQDATQTPFVGQWVGMDGTGCGTGLIQAGTISQVCGISAIESKVSPAGNQG
jgi:hypothetical protein